MSWLASGHLYLLRAAAGKFNTSQDRRSRAMSKFSAEVNEYVAQEAKLVIILRLLHRST